MMRYPVDERMSRTETVRFLIRGLFQGRVPAGAWEARDSASRSMIAGLRHGDTQCGVKGFRGSVVESLISLLKIDGFAFDVEILRAIRDQGLVSCPIAVHLRNGEHSTVRLFRDSSGMLRDLFAIRIRALQGHYKTRAFVSHPAGDRLELPVHVDP